MQNQFKSREEAAGYLGGLIDGEGTIALYYHSGAMRSRHIMISNTEPSIMQAAQEACDLLDLTYSLKEYTRYHKTNKKPEFRLYIYGHQNCARVQELVPIRCVYKCEKLQMMLDSFERSMQRRKQGKRSFADVEEVIGPHAES